MPLNRAIFSASFVLRKNSVAVFFVCRRVVISQTIIKLALIAVLSIFEILFCSCFSDDESVLFFSFSNSVLNATIRSLFNHISFLFISRDCLGIPIKPYKCMIVSFYFLYLFYCCGINFVRLSNK